MSDPQISFSSDELINVVQVIGGKPSGSKAAVTATVVAPRTHPLSPWSIGRNGKPRYLLKTIENPDVRTTAKAKALAQSELDRYLVQQVDVTYECRPVPHLEPWDIVTLKSARFNLTHRVNKFSLPLRAGKSMTVGYQANLSQPRRIVRSA